MKRLNKDQMLELLIRLQDGRATCIHVLEKIEEGQDELIDLLTSARAIAERKGKDTAWERFSQRVGEAGVGSVTAKVFKILPSDLESSKEPTTQNSVEADLAYVQSFACDVVASLSLAREYDLKKLAHAINGLLGQYGALKYEIIDVGEYYGIDPFKE